ncbi:MAG: 4Fe-4S dicluster domain-containing protein [Candidatus Thiothrix putei]|uniref:4Fe-4S dicluster domain-containing protein n=1 Tax=Candidatus Thiothrix putei TaxID=3080811 RepID=A0AA95HG78_9GAMM|nr:MAG: 4Fe-4S dicluster domain-containing protein [Candidatus Thiothrix putei]
MQACPCGLLLLEMAANARAGNLDDAVTKLGLMDCIACGSCSYVCPAHIPLVQYFNYAKGELAALVKVAPVVMVRVMAVVPVMLLDLGVAKVMLMVRLISPLP